MDFGVDIVCYGYDLQDLTDDIVKAEKSRQSCCVTADKRTTVGAGTRDQVNRLRQLQAVGVKVFVADGYPLQPEYASVGRPVRPGKGIVHAKVCRVGPWLVHGSANFTTSSKCNYEIGSLIYLSQAGSRAVDQWLETLRAKSEPLSEELLTQGEDNRVAAVERRRSAESLPAVHLDGRAGANSVPAHEAGGGAAA